MKRRPKKQMLRLPETLQGLRDKFTELSLQVQKKENLAMPVIEHRRPKKFRGHSKADVDEQEKKILRGLCRGLWERLHKVKVAYY
jgi:hypothetical protein